MKEDILIRPAKTDDWPGIWTIFREVIRGGDTFVFAPDSPEEKMKAYWMHPDKYTYVALIGETVAGSFIFNPNQPDLGSHIANASYMVNPEFKGKGIGRAMGECSLKEAKAKGFQAMQFNIVVKSNETAVRLWKSLGFEVVGEIPEAYQHKNLGLTNALIMYRKLT